MSYPKLNSENNQLIGKLVVDYEIKIIKEEERVEYSITNFQVKNNSRLNELIKDKKIKLAFTLECDSTFLKEKKYYGETIRWNFDDIGGDIKSSYFLICDEPFSLEPNPKLIDPFYNTTINYKKHYLISPIVTDIHKIKKLNLGSSIDFIKIKHAPKLRTGNYSFYTDDTSVKLLIKEKETYKKIKQLLKNKKTSPILKQLTFFPFFVEILSIINQEDSHEEWHNQFKDMLGLNENQDLSDYDSKYNFLVNALVNKPQEDSMKLAIEKIDKIINRR